MKALDLHCVRISDKATKRLQDLKDKRSDDHPDFKKMNDGLESLLIKVHLDKPQWRFELDCDYTGRLYSFSVYQDSELLGEVDHTYVGRKVGFGYAVKNERIREAMSRGRAYQTGDIDKAYVKIKKTFGKQSLTERFNKAWDETNKVINQNYHYKTRSINDFDRTIMKYAMNYAMNAGFEQFMEYMNTKAPITDRNTLAKSVHDKEQVVSELATIDQVRSKLGTLKTAVIIRDGSSYIYKHGEVLTMYDDATLPEEIRGKLGLLKLVEAEHYVENTGCRVNDEVFVIVMEDNNA
jgi:hypothetical protein